ncbi:hypothetical protein EMCRGX_G019107 [Ephydatia muelleri]
MEEPSWRQPSRDVDLVSNGQSITWNGQLVRNNSLVTLSVVPNRVSSSAPPQYPLVCQGNTGGQRYEPSGVLFPLAIPDPVSTPGGLGQRNVSGGVELYRGTPTVFPHGVQCCTNTTITLCVGMYSDLTLAIYLAMSNNYGLSVAATYGPNITGGVQFQLLTPTNVDPPVFQLTCTSTSSPPTDVLWTTNGSPVSNTSSQIVTDRPTPTYNNTLTVTGRAYGMYTCTVTTTCSPVCGGFTLNPRSTTSSLTIQAPSDPPTGVTAVQSGPTSVSVSWTAPTSGGPVTRYDIYYVANGGDPSTSGGSTISTSYVLTNLQVGVQYNISVIAVGTSLPSLSANVILTLIPSTPSLTVAQVTSTSITVMWSQPGGEYTITGLQEFSAYILTITASIGVGSSPPVPQTWYPPVTVEESLYYLSLPNTSKRQLSGYTSHTFPPTTTWGDINNLNPNGVYQFSVVAQVTIMGQLYSGEMDTSLVNTPTITPGSSNLVSTCNCGGVLAGSLVAEFVVLAVAMVPAVGYKTCILVAHDWGGAVAWSSDASGHLHSFHIHKMLLVVINTLPIFNIGCHQDILNQVVIDILNVVPVISELKGTLLFYDYAEKTLDSESANLQQELECHIAAVAAGLPAINQQHQVSKCSSHRPCYRFPDPSNRDGTSYIWYLSQKIHAIHPSGPKFINSWLWKHYKLSPRSDCDKAWKAMTGCDSYVKDGWVLAMKIHYFRHDSNNRCIVMGKVRHSQKINAVPVLPWVVLELNGTVLCAHCTCMAGLGGSCSHVAAIIFCLVRAAESQKKFGEDACTSKKCSWLPAIKEVAPSKIVTVNFSSSTTDCAKTVSQCKLKPHHVVQPPTDSEIDTFYQTMNSAQLKPAILRIVPEYADQFAPGHLALDLPLLMSQL